MGSKDWRKIPRTTCFRCGQKVGSTPYYQYDNETEEYIYVLCMACNAQSSDDPNLYKKDVIEELAHHGITIKELSGRLER